MKHILLYLLLPGLVACGGPPADDEAPPPPPAGRPSFPFVDVTASTGVDVVHDNGAAGRRHYPETMAPGVALFDADGDGDSDLYAVQGSPLGPPAAPGPPNRFYLNRGDGTFDDTTETSGLGDTGHGMGAAVGDADGDGDLDVYVVNYGPNALYENLGDGRFRRAEAGVEDPEWSVGAAFFDADGDGDLDLWVVNYLDYDAATAEPCRAGSLTIYCSPEQFPAAPDRLYRNDADADGGLRFTDVSLAAGVRGDGRGMGLAVGDLDGDGDPDLYVTNDKSQNQLYRNDSPPPPGGGQWGGFTEIGAEAGVGYGETGQIEGGMGAVLGDLAGDGRAAIFMTNFQKEPNRLYVAAPGLEGMSFFDDATFPSGLGFPSAERVSWGIGLLDVEGDGDLDLAVANGHVWDNAAEFIPGSAYEMADQLFLNDAAGRFETLEFPGPALASRGVAAGDLDGDGDPDLVIASCGDRLRVWRNEAGRPERFLVVELRDRAPNSHAYGARLVARAGGREPRREVTGGGSYASHSDTRILLGLGEAGVAERLEVRWSDGTTEESGALEGGQRVVWRRGEGIVERTPLSPEDEP